MTPTYLIAIVPCPICGNSIIARLEPPDYSVGIFGYAVYELTPVTPDDDCGHIDQVNEMLCDDPDDPDDPRIEKMLENVP